MTSPSKPKTGETAHLSTLIDDLRSADHTLYLASLFAPANRRRTLMALYLFHVEAGRIAGRANEPMAALIRFQWWRDALCDRTVSNHHPVTAILAEAMSAGGLARDALIKLIDVREAALDNIPFRQPDDIVAHAQATGGRLFEIAALFLGEGRPALLAYARQIGTAHSVSRILSKALDVENDDVRWFAADLAAQLALSIRPVAPERTAIAAFMPVIAARADLQDLATGKSPPMQRPGLPLRLVLRWLLGRV